MLIIQSVRCRFCRGKLELHGEGMVLMCPSCRKGTRLPRKLKLSDLRPDDYEFPRRLPKPKAGKAVQ